jgi:hypothetical protein
MVQRLEANYVRACKNKRVDHYGKSSNHLFETLAYWNTYLESECPDVYSTTWIIKPAP